MQVILVQVMLFKNASDDFAVPGLIYIYLLVLVHLCF